MIRWVQIASSSAELTSLLGSNELTMLNVKGSKICVGQYRGSFFALGDKCPHAGGSLSRGRCEAGKVICPLHRMQYDIKNGREFSGEGFYVNTYPLQVRDEGVYLGLPAKKWWELW